MDTVTAAAIAGAEAHRLEAATRPAQPPDLTAAVRADIRQLGVIVPAAGIADALLANGWQPVALDRDTMEATSAAMTEHAAVLEHWTARPGDGVGVELGHRRGATTVAVRGTQSGFNSWMADVGVERREVEDDYGQTAVRASYRDPGRFVRAHWIPRPVSVRATAVALGPVAIMAEGERFRADRAGAAEVGFVAWSVTSAWSVGGQPGQHLEFESHRAGQVTVVADGVLPLHVTRSDGWTLTSTGVPPVSDSLPEWLVEALGGRWVETAAPLRARRA